ncbi:MAG TPA: hypothetical protein VI408_12890 [Gaiellaceae bacterium]
MARVLSTAIVLALLAATAGAFALTEGAKLERSPIYGTRVDPLFSPNGKAHPVANIAFRVRTRERIDVWIESTDGHKVTELLKNRATRPRQLVSVVWDAFTPSGIAARDGVYRPVVKLVRSHRTIVLPSDIRLDTVAPKIRAHLANKYPIISPDGDGHGDSLRIPYTVNEPAHGILLLRGKQVVYTNGQKLTGVLVWSGRRRGKGLRPGRYLLSVAAQDRAGNRSKAVPVAIAQIRYVVLARQRVVVKPGRKFALRVSTDAPTVEWRLHGRSGVQRSGTLHFTSPKSAGVYRLYVSAGNHTAVCAVVVA